MVLYFLVLLPIHLAFYTDISYFYWTSPFEVISHCLALFIFIASWLILFAIFKMIRFLDDMDPDEIKTKYFASEIKQ